MSEVKDVRAALKVLAQDHGECLPRECVSAAVVSEGLAACDEYEADTLQGARQPDHDESVRLNVFASILRKAGLM